MTPQVESTHREHTTGKQRRAFAIALVLAPLALALALFATPASAAAPSITITPSSGLTNGQSVTVSISGFSANVATINVVQCLSTGSSASSCNVADGKLFQKTNASGALTVTMTVRTTFGANDCTKSQCMIAAHEGTSATSGNNAQKNISFASAAKPTPTTTHATTASTPTSTSATAGGATSSAAAAGTAAPTGADTGTGVSTSPPLLAELGAALAVLLLAVGLALRLRQTHKR
jgi:hypothetical protein